MDLTIFPRPLTGSLNIIPSKSQAHRLLILAAFADKPTQIICSQTNEDIEATAACLRAIGAQVLRTDDGYTVTPVTHVADQAVLPCGESGSSLRFLLPVAGALGMDATFVMKGRLPQRPLSPLWEEMERMGCSLSRPGDDTLRCTGKLRSGHYEISGDVSSQFITGLMFAQCIMDDHVSLTITGNIQSKPYIDMTRDSIALFAGTNGRLCSPGFIDVEGDWSNGAFFLAANTLADNQLTVLGLNEQSSQGDRSVTGILQHLKNGNVVISAADIPDLVPILSIVAAVHHGAVFTDIQRLRLKESDRVASVISMIRALGGEAAATEDSLIIHKSILRGGVVDSQNDHRIAMSAAIAATVCSQPVTILDAHCVNKSYPAFWDEYKKLGGYYEQHLR